MPTSDAAQQLYTALAQIPEGCVITYGQLARLAGRPGAARWAGSLVRKLPKDSQLPWHRVVNASGCISLPPDAGGREQKQRLLNEGVQFTGERIKLSQHQW
ncbi:MGMT family protein [Gilvimarinus chinensis]|uniref:MGMT family protein n=1 Tax=Gilvimarinus chinensis TaxID=396005 RepID=UPI00036C4163|nr:MGMT family protein [Gilvimarinus chinensis]